MRFHKKRVLSVANLCHELILVMERKQYLQQWIEQLTLELNTAKDQIAVAFCCDIFQSVVQILEIWKDDKDILECTLILFHHLFLIREVSRGFLTHINNILISLEVFLVQELNLKQWERVLDVVMFLTCDINIQTVCSLVLQSENFLLCFSENFEIKHMDMKPKSQLKYYAILARLFGENNIPTNFLINSFHSLNIGLSLFENPAIFFPCAVALKRWISEALKQFPTEISTFLDEILTVPIVFRCIQVEDIHAFELLSYLCETETGRKRLKDDKFFLRTIDRGITNLENLPCQHQSLLALGNLATYENCPNIVDSAFKIIDVFFKQDDAKIAGIQSWVLSSLLKEVDYETFKNKFNKEYLHFLQNYVLRYGKDVSGNHLGALKIMKCFMLYHEYDQQQKERSDIEQFREWIHFLIHNSTYDKVQESASKFFHEYLFHPQQATEWFGMRSRTRISLPF